MKKIIYFAASATLLLACNGSKPGYTISGTVSNPNLNGEVLYLSEYATADPLDSVVVEKGVFFMEGNQDNPELCVLAFSEGLVDPRANGPGEEGIFSTVFILENGNLQAVLDSTSSVSGTPENDGLKKHKEEIKKLNQQSQLLVKKIKNSRHLGDEDKAELKKLYDVYIKQRLEIAKNYIESHLHKLSGGYIFGQYVDFMGGDMQTSTLAKANDTFKSAPGVKKVCDNIEKMKALTPGSMFTDFSMMSADGKTKKLSDYVGNGKDYVLVDFWASWCPPCRKEMPTLVDLYKMYNGKGLQIVGVSLDEKDAAWKKGIKQMDMTWPQLSDLNGWKNEAAVLYGVTSIPQTLLIAPDGKIVAWGLNGDALKTKITSLMKK